MNKIRITLIDAEIWFNRKFGWFLIKPQNRWVLTRIERELKIKRARLERIG